MRHNLYLLILSFAAILNSGCQSGSSSKRQSKTNSLDYIDIQMAEIKKPSVGELKFISFWKDFANSARKSDYKKFSQITVDTLSVCDSKISVNAFIKDCYHKIFDNVFFKSLKDSSNILYEYSDTKDAFVGYGEPYGFQLVQVTKRTTDTSGYLSLFYFIETKDGYKFYKCTNNKNMKCCR